MTEREDDGLVVDEVGGRVLAGRVGLVALNEHEAMAQVHHGLPVGSVHHAPLQLGEVAAVEQAGATYDAEWPFDCAAAAAGGGHDAPHVPSSRARWNCELCDGWRGRYPPTKYCGCQSPTPPPREESLFMCVYLFFVFYTPSAA